MAKGFNWNRVRQQTQLRQQGDLHWKDTEKKPQLFAIEIMGQRWNKHFITKASASKAANTIQRKYGKPTRVVKIA
jgi:uncharacterized protein (DUF2249 family)